MKLSRACHVSASLSSMVNSMATQELIAVHCRSLSTQELVFSAGSEGNLEMAKLLVEEGLDVQAACIDGKTAIHYATQFGQEEIVYFLLQRDAEQLVNKPDGSGWTPLHYAAEQGCLSLVESFLQVSLTMRIL